jgi:hypothetical protein
MGDLRYVYCILAFKLFLQEALIEHKLNAVFFELPILGCSFGFL